MGGRAAIGWGVAVAVLGALAAESAWAAGLPEPSCWFYVYRWTRSESTGGTGDFHTYQVSGMGTGMMVTTGDKPSRDEKSAVEDRLAAAMPHLKDAPPPMASITQATPVPCPADWPRIPGVPPELLDHPRY